MLSESDILDGYLILALVSYMDVLVKDCSKE